MSEEIKRIINECSCVDTFDYVITPQQRDTMLLAEYIKELQQENQQLKDRIDANEFVIDEFTEENTILKSVLDEIREYIDNTVYYTSDMKYFKDSVIGEDLLKILDKVKEL